MKTFSGYIRAASKALWVANPGIFSFFSITTHFTYFNTWTNIGRNLLIMHNKDSGFSRESNPGLNRMFGAFRKPQGSLYVGMWVVTWFTSYIQVRTFEWSDLPRPAIGQSQVIDKPIGNLSETGDEGETVRTAGQRADQPATRDRRLTLWLREQCSFIRDGVSCG